MGMKHLTAISLTVGLALTLGACAADGLTGGPTTAALPEKPKVDPACASLASRIDALRKDGVADRVEQVAAGKGATVNMKRESLGKIVELNKANADFQAKCSTYKPPSGSVATLTPGAGQTPASALTKAPVSAAAVAAGAAVTPAAPVVPAAAKGAAIPAAAKAAAAAVQPKAQAADAAETAKAATSQ